MDNNLQQKLARGKHNSYWLNCVIPANNSNGHLLINEGSTGIPRYGNIISQKTPFDLTIGEINFRASINNGHLTTPQERDQFYATLMLARVSVYRLDTTETVAFTPTEIFDPNYDRNGGVPSSRPRIIYGDVQSFNQNDDIKIYLDNFLLFPYAVQMTLNIVGVSKNLVTVNSK